MKLECQISICKEVSSIISLIKCPASNKGTPQRCKSTQNHSQGPTNKASKITGFHPKQAHNITWTYSSHNQEIDLNVLVCNGHHAIEKWRFWLTNREVNQSFILLQGNTIGISEHRRLQVTALYVSQVFTNSQSVL